MSNNIQTFEEFLKNDKYKTERKKLEDYFQQLRQQKHILNFQQWQNQPIRKFLFLTYDLVHAADYGNPYSDINAYLAEMPMGFSREIYGRPLTNNCFVSFIEPINPVVMNNIGNALRTYFTLYLPDFRIYLNITAETDYFLHTI